MSFEAFWLPALDSPPIERRRFGSSGDGVELHVPVLSSSDLVRQMDALLAARESSLVGKPVGDVVRIVDRVARRFLDRSDPLRRAADELLSAATGLSRPMTELVLERMAADWEREPLERLLAAELGDPRVLDDFVDGGEKRSRLHAVGPRLVTHFFSGNVPGVGVTSLIRALLVKAASLGKSASGEPVLAPLFARAVAEEDAALGACLAVTYWEGGHAVLEGPAVERADLVIAYGGAAAIASIRARTGADTTFLAYGNRVSFAVVAREALASEGAADDLARDMACSVATFDQQGCVSPHAVFVERGGRESASEWAGRLAVALERLEAELPRGTVSSAESSAIRQLRGEAEIAQISGARIELHASRPGTEWTVVLDEAPGFRPSCLNRTIRVVPVDSLEEIIERVAPLGGLMQTAGIAGPEDRIRPFARRLARLGVSRVTPIARMSWPPPWWHHDGRPPIADLVRWCDWE